MQVPQRYADATAVVVILKEVRCACMGVGAQPCNGGCVVGS